MLRSWLWPKRPLLVKQKLSLTKPEILLTMGSLVVAEAWDLIL